MHLKTDTKGANAHFAKVPTISKSRNSFGVAERHLTTMGFDYLYPIQHKWIYPGDTLSVQLSMMARLTTQVATLYDDLYFDIHAWFVPLRLLSDYPGNHWARLQFNEQEAPNQDNTALHAPVLDNKTLRSASSNWARKQLADYFNYPVWAPYSTNGVDSSTQKLNSYLLYAYAMIWDENYRDQNLQQRVVEPGEYGTDDVSIQNIGTLLRRGKRHDRFTSALPWQQKGTPPGIPLTGVAPVLPDTIGAGARFVNKDTGASLPTSAIQADSFGFTNDGTTIGYIDPNGTLYADLAQSLAYMVVNDLRTSIAVQQLLEADARGGTRSVEAIQNRWGVTVPDFRLQRPEYLGGSTFTFDGHVVPQTSETNTTPQGNLTQFSQALSSMRVNHSFVEHGVFIALISARSNLTYQYSFQKELGYYTRFDWNQPEFANIGEVAIKNRELFAQGIIADEEDLDVWAYNEYGYEMRFGLNRVSGEFPSDYAQSRDNKHMATDFATLPPLNDSFIESNTPISRNIAVSAELAHPIELNCMMSGTISRVLPMYSVPGLLRL